MGNRRIWAVMIVAAGIAYAAAAETDPASGTNPVDVPADAAPADLKEGEGVAQAEAFAETTAPSVTLEAPSLVPPETPTPQPETQSEETPAYFKAHQAAWNEAPADAVTGSAANPGLALDAMESGLSRDVLRWMMYLIFLCGAIILTGYLLKRYGRRTPLLAGLRYGEVLGRLHLAPRVSLHFVKTGGRVLVVGVTQNNVSMLTEFDAEAFDAAQQDNIAEVRETPKPGGFLSQLQAIAKSESAAPPVDDDLAALRGDIQRLQRYLQKGGSESQE